MIPGKTYTVDDVIAILWRWKWMIVLPAVLGGIGAFAYARTLPDRYRSDTVIMMLRQRVREDLIRSTVRTTLREQIQTISQQIMSRTRLESIIVDLNLYPEDRESGLLEDVIERMRQDVGVQTVRGDAFRVSYISDSPVTAMHVAERLAGLFIDENLKNREQLAQGTSQFLESQLEDARQRLIEQEKRLEAYRRAHAGELPSQVQSNLAAINSAQLQAQRLQDALSRDRDQLQILERQLADTETPPEPASEPVLDSTAGSISGGSAGQQLNAARAALRQMELRLKPEHPDIGRMQRLITTLEQKAEKEALEVPLSGDASGDAPRNKAEAARAARRREIEGRTARLGQAIRTREIELDRIKKVVAEYQRAARRRADPRDRAHRAHQGLRHLAAALYEPARQERGIEAECEPRGEAGRPAIHDPGPRTCAIQTVYAESDTDARHGRAGWRGGWPGSRLSDRLPG